MADTTQPAGDGFPKSDWKAPDTGVQLAPGGAAAAQAGGYAPTKPDPAFNPAPVVAPKRIPVVVDLSGRAMSKTFDLQWPKSVDGVEFRQIAAHRISTAEVAAFIDRVRSAADGDDLPYPIFRRVDGAPLTAAEWAALDPDDTDTLLKDADAFLPARWKALASAPASASPQPAPATTDSSSPASPASPSAS